MPDLTALWISLAPYLKAGPVANALGILWCVAYAALVLALGGALARWPRVPSWAPRWATRVATAGWVIVAFYWIDLWPASWFVPLAYLYLNSRVAKTRWTNPLAPDDDAEPPLGNAGAMLLLVLLWWWPGYQFIAMAGVMALAVGGGASEYVGRRWGKHRFRFRGSRGLTSEGIVAMAAASLVAIFITTFSYARIPGVWFGPWAFFGALLTTAVATTAMLYTPRPWDRWSVPLLAAVTMHYYAKAGFHF